MSKRDERAASLARANDGKDWETMRPTERDEYRRQATREGFTDEFDPTNPSDAVEPSMRGRLADLTALFQVIDGDADQADEETIEGLDLGAEYDDHELQREPDYEAAEEGLDTFALSVERRVSFEIVFGTGGPDDRLIVECSALSNEAGEQSYGLDYEVQRIVYRFSWSGSAEVVLSGEDFETAKRYAERVVPELE